MSTASNAETSPLGTDSSPFLTVIVPAFNEENTLEDSLSRLRRAIDRIGVAVEVIVVNDGSTDRTATIAADFRESWSKVVVYSYSENRGKGKAVLTGLKYAHGRYCVVHDADCEYDPEDIARLLEPIIDGRARVVYGNRFENWPPIISYGFLHCLGNKILTLWSNLWTGLAVRDMETCYKVFPTEFLKKIAICSEGFAFEPEVTAWLGCFQKQLPFAQIPISYSPRTYAEGKKINIWDALRALVAIPFFSHRAKMGPELKPEPVFEEVS